MNMAIKAGAVVALGLLGAPALAAPVIADSVADFTGVQGLNGWHYGWYNFEDVGQEAGSVAVDTGAFHQFGYFDSDTGWWASSAFAAGGYPTGGAEPGSYAVITASRMHPNAPLGSANVVAEEHWAARRWISNVSGEVTLSGLIAHHHYDGAPIVGNGTEAHILVDGVSVFSYDVDLLDFEGIAYSLDLIVTEGTVIDFVVGGKGNPLFDATTFTARVTTPTPASVALLGLGGLVAGRRRRVL